MTATTGSAQEFAAAKFDGVVVWGNVNPPRDQLRSLQKTERVEILATEGSGWLHIRLPEGVEGFVHGGNLRAWGTAALGSDAARARPLLDPAEPRRFPGAPRVALGLTIFAWLCAIGGQLFGIGAAADYNCAEDTFGFTDCSDEGSTRFVLYLTFAVPSFITALFAWGIAYTIALVRHLEDRWGPTASAEPQRMPAPVVPAPATPAPDSSERCEVCGNVFAAGGLTILYGKRMCQQCAAAAQL